MGSSTVNINHAGLCSRVRLRCHRYWDMLSVAQVRFLGGARREAGPYHLLVN